MCGILHFLIRNRFCFFLVWKLQILFGNLFTVTGCLLHVFCRNFCNLSRWSANKGLSSWISEFIKCEWFAGTQVKTETWLYCATYKKFEFKKSISKWGQITGQSSASQCNWLWGFNWDFSWWANFDSAHKFNVFWSTFAIQFSKCLISTYFSICNDYSQKNRV